jgi:MFS family permease
MDVSSELVLSLLPVFMATVLGANMIMIGVIEGLAEATASVTRVFSGALSDRWRRRKPIVVFGYVLAACAKPVFPLAHSVTWVAAARFVDRIGKGIRGAPRDALIADITPVPLRGSAYGLRQALDSAGALLGPLLALVFMGLTANNLQAVLWIAVVPAALSVFILLTAVHEPKRAIAAPIPAGFLRGWRQLGYAYWFTVSVAAAFTLARFSEAFLLLRAQQLGLRIGLIPLVMMALSAIYAVAAYPAGHAADRMSARGMLLTGSLLLIAADLLLAYAHSIAVVFLGVALWGLHMAVTQGLLSKLVADAAPPELRGTAFGMLGLITGFCALIANSLAGVLWNVGGPAATFIAGAGFSAIAVAALSRFPSRR